MDTPNQAGLAAEAAPATTPEASPAAAPSAPVVETVSTEPRHPLQDILDKAAKKKADQAAAQQPSQPVEQKGLPEKAPESTAFDIGKWNGDVAALPEKLQKIVIDNQRAFHEKAMRVSQLEQEVAQLKQPQQQPSNQPLFSADEFAEAQLDPTKFSELMDRVVNARLQQATQQIAPILNQVQFQQAVAENERLISQFAEQHTDFWDLHDAGLIKPFLDSTKDLGQAYNEAKKVYSSMQQKATSDAQARVQEKRSASVLSPTAGKQVEVVYVDREGDVLPTAAKFAAEGKRVKVKVNPNHRS